TVRGKSRHFRTVSFDAERNAVLLIEQRLLPHKFTIVGTRDFRETAAAIHDMVVRGAGAIGATAAYGLAQGVRAFKGRERKKFSAHHETVYRTLKAARPTAVDPVNAMDQVRAAMRQGETIEDNAAGHLMQRGKIDLVIVGSDRTLGRTGEVANKIGTYTKAVLAARHGIPFYVAIPLSTIDWNLKSGFNIPIEERHESEVLGAWGARGKAKPETRNPKREIGHARE